MRTFDVVGSTGHVYTVEERVAERGIDRGTTYLWCPCQGWVAAFRNGNDCKHVREARGQIAFGIQAKVVQPEPVLVLDTKKPVWYAEPGQPTAEDEAVAAALLNWAGAS